VKQRKEKFVENLIQTLKNATRASIFYQLARKPESTATEISKNLGEDVDVVYYHLKLLKEAGLISKPRVVVKENYVEKYYSIVPDFKNRLLQSVKQLSAEEKALAVDEFRELLITLFTVVQSILASSTRMLKKVDARVIREIRDEDNIESKIIFCSKERYVTLLREFREIAKGDVLETFDSTTKEYVIAVVAIPKLS